MNELVWIAKTLGINVTYEKYLCSFQIFMCQSPWYSLKEINIWKMCSEIWNSSTIKSRKNEIIHDVWFPRTSRPTMNEYFKYLLLVIRFIEKTRWIFNIAWLRCHVGVGSHCLKQRCSLSFSVFSEFFWKFGSSVYFLCASPINVICYKRGNVGAQSYCCFQ